MIDSDRNRNLLWAIILLLVTLLLGLAFVVILLVRVPLGGNGSGSAVDPTSTAAGGGSTGGGTPGLPPTPLLSDPALRLGIPAWTDTFASSANWAEFDNECFRSDIRDGRFWMEAKGGVSLFCWELSWPQINRFYLETLARIEADCPEGGAYGLFLRGPDTSRGYLFGLTCEDEYAMYAWTGDNGSLILPPQASRDLTAGEENRIGILADGNYFSLYLNGVFQTQVFDSSFPDGVRIGFFIRTPGGQVTLVSFDNLTYWDLP